MDNIRSIEDAAASLSTAWTKLDQRSGHLDNRTTIMLDWAKSVTLSVQCMLYKLLAEERSQKAEEDKRAAHDDAAEEEIPKFDGPNLA